MMEASFAKDKVAKRSRREGAASSSTVRDVRFARRRVLVFGISGVMASRSLKMGALGTGFVYS